MTDTPDALKLFDDLIEIYEYGGTPDKLEHALRARIEAGDAAIKRVAALDKFHDDAVKYLQLFKAIQESAEADLAAARAEIERLRSGIKKIQEEPQNTMSNGKALHNMMNLATNLLGKHKTALAPKETNNG
jgi:hypothetical protein